MVCRKENIVTCNITRKLSEYGRSRQLSTVQTNRNTTSYLLSDLKTVHFQLDTAVQSRQGTLCYTGTCWVQWYQLFICCYNLQFFIQRLPLHYVCNLMPVSRTISTKQTKTCNSFSISMNEGFRVKSYSIN